MARARPTLRDRLGAAAVPAAAALLTLYFGANAVFSETGLIAWGGYRAEAQALAAEAARVRAARSALQHRVKLLDPRRIDPDYADELVRDRLGLVRPDEVVVPLPSGG
ncbi:MAG: septum formation initiator family protein [Sphingomonadaceae bacterium]|nr:septum formation initiator family protein [Sphingomonadaceae bacterium]